MLDKAMETTVGALDRRFLLTSFVPTAAFLGLLTVTLRPGAFGAWERESTGGQVAQGIVFLLAAALCAGLVSGTTVPLLRFLEGYWPGPLGAFGRRHHRAVLVRLGKEGPYQRIESGYPLPSDLAAVLPTTLGNVLRNAERYPAYRYGLDAVVVWPRLYLVASDRALAGVASARSDVDLQATVCALSALYGVIAGAEALVTGRPWGMFLLVFTVPMAVAMVTYRAAVAAARVYGVQLKAVFDLHRLELLEKVAPDLEGPEPDRWHSVQQLWYRAIPLEASVPEQDREPVAEETDPPWWVRVPLSGWFALIVVTVSLLAAPMSLGR